MAASVIIVVLILVSFQIFRKSYPLDSKTRKVSSDELEILSDKYFGFFMLYTVASLPAFLLSLFLFIWLFQPYNLSELVPFGLSFSCFALVPKLIIDNAAEKRGEEWFNGLKVYLDNRYSFDYFRVFRVLLVIIYAMSVGMVMLGLGQTFLSS